MTSHEDSAKLASRAILILLVVLGHNRIFHDHLYYTGYIFLYSFHVGSFFLLATFGKPRPLNKTTFYGMWRAFLKPYAIFTTIYGLMFLITEAAKGHANLLTWFIEFIAALLIATSPFLDAATGLKLLWFLPSFFVFCILYNWYGLADRRLKAGILAAACLAHFGLPALSRQDLAIAPLGSALAAYLLLPALVFMQLRCLQWRTGAIATNGVIFALSSSALIYLRLESVLAEYRIFGIQTPIDMVVADASLISGACCVVSLGRALSHSRTAQWVGSRSLQVYLIHAPINFLAVTLCRDIAFWPLGIVLASVGTAVLTCAAIAVVERTRVVRIVFG